MKTGYSMAIGAHKCRGRMFLGQQTRNRQEGVTVEILSESNHKKHTFIY